jgi:hypothetical protein
VPDNTIGTLTFFLNPQLIVQFGLPLVIPADGRQVQRALEQ